MFIPKLVIRTSVCVVALMALGGSAPAPREPADAPPCLRWDDYTKDVRRRPDPWFHKDHAVYPADQIQGYRKRGTVSGQGFQPHQWLERGKATSSHPRCEG